MATDFKHVFAKNLRNQLARHNKLQNDLVNDLGLNKSTVSTWINGTKMPRMNTVERLAAYFGVEKSDLIEDKRNSNTKTKAVRIPVLGKVVAGVPLEAVEEILDYEEITPELAATGEFFALQIRGRSMEPRMLEGDVVIVRKQDDVESGDIAIVLVNGDEATVKKIKKMSTGITLIATNISVYEPHFYSNEEIEALPVQILGKVVELRGKF
nr:MAG TPA: Repressor protein CI [Caudoviricetes sp.]